MRAFAAVLVFLFHYARLPYGWAGVDIFFVLSGFLITGILYDNRHAEHRFRNFYVRRVFRIFPLYYAVLLLLFLAIPIFHLQWKHLSLIWFAYLGNYLDWFHPSTTAYQNIGRWHIGHFWSLCVEEQFYLIWPAVVFFTAARKRLIQICLAVVILLPFVRLLLCLSVPLRVVEAGAIYSSTPTRIDTLLLGALIALWMRGPEKDRMLRAGTSCLLTAVAILASMHLLTTYYFRPQGAVSRFWMPSFGYSLTALAGAGILLISLNDNSWMARIFRLRPVRSFGQRTYGFYVYHVLPFLFFPVLVRWFTLHGVPYLVRGVASYLILVGGLLVITYASYRYFETPFLRLKDRYTLREPRAEARVRRAA